MGLSHEATSSEQYPLSRGRFLIKRNTDPRPMKITVTALLLSVLLLPTRSFAQESVLGNANAIRIAEAQQLLAHVRSDPSWKWDTVPFAILLLTEERDYLIGHPSPTADFQSEGVDPILGLDIFSRPRTEAWSLQFLATFPAVGGVPTVVVGTAEATGRSSTAWVVTLLHEHFHQIQYSSPDYYAHVDALELDGGDTSGMWMLNYAFPYEDDAVINHLGDLAETLSDTSDSGDALEHTNRILRQLKSTLTPADYRYLTFQFWQEGTARYMEHVVARLAADGYTPTDAFMELDDVTSYSTYQATLDRQLKSELSNMNVASQQRLVMYPLGASFALLLEKIDAGWMDRYFNPSLSTVRLLDEDL